MKFLTVTDAKIAKSHGFRGFCYFCYLRNKCDSRSDFINFLNLIHWVRLKEAI